MQDIQPITQDLVLIGGGHSHAIALKQLGMQPPPGVRITLITDVSHTPYSGMLPAYVAGLYRFDDCHIDLRPLSQFAKAVMIVDRAVGLDLNQNRVLLAHHPPVAFDRVSIDIGSTPATLTVPGAADLVIPVKPISQFLAQWDRVISSVKTHFDRLRVAIVGGGAGGVELTLAVQARLEQLYRAAHQPSTQIEVQLLHRGERLVPERSAWVGRRLHQILARRRVNVHLGENVTAISEAPSGKQLHCDSGLTVECDLIFWVTQASAADWLGASGLATDHRGFVQVNRYLQSISHPQVFAAGDVATMVEHPRPKAGVFAVRQGKPLVQNLYHTLSGQPLQPFVPQTEFLILIGTADRAAIASRGPLGIGPHPLLWQWKDHIDRKFMAQFRDLKLGSAMRPSRPTVGAAKIPQPQMHCAGCGSKVGHSVLKQVLSRLQSERQSERQSNGLMKQRSDILLGLDAPDDAAVLQVPADQVMVQTVDHFPALLSDPFVFGQICTNHCLSDLFAMNATPQSALAIVTLPYATEAKLEETLYQLLAGVVSQLSQAGAVLVGGHTREGPELALGLACNGLADPTQLWQKSGLQPDQTLILTKALGTGTLFAAEMQLQAKGRWIEAAIESMLHSNQKAAICLRQFETTACTDITGFGLAGHLLELIQASQVAVALDLNAVPLLTGAKETLQRGMLSSLHPQNFRAAQQIENLEQIRTHPLFPILFDPQTAGGLLAAVPSRRAASCISALRAAGYPAAQVIGRVLPPQGAFPLSVQM